MDIISTLAIAFFGFVLGLIATWISARVSKSTDTKTQILLKIDDWVNDITQFCSMFFWNLGTGKLQEEIFLDFEKLESIRWKGVAKGLNNKLLADKIELFNENIGRFGLMLSKAVSKGDYFDDKAISNKELLLNHLKINRVADDIHEIITREMLRILPNWPERVWLWIKGKK
jgi:hypothetical protein